MRYVYIFLFYRIIKTRDVVLMSHGIILKNIISSSYIAIKYVILSFVLINLINILYVDIVLRTLMFSRLIILFDIHFHYVSAL